MNLTISITRSELNDILNVEESFELAGLIPAGTDPFGFVLDQFLFGSKVIAEETSIEVNPTFGAAVLLAYEVGFPVRSLCDKLNTAAAAAGFAAPRTADDGENSIGAFGPKEA